MDFEATRHLLARLSRQLPCGHLFAEARLHHIGKQLDEQPDDVNIALKAHFDSFLRKMPESEASDIDIGGPGCRSQIWYRIFGNKSPNVTLGEYNIGETDILLLNILTESERHKLFEERSLDVSYSIFEKDTATWNRFRAHFYFDLGHLTVNMRRINDQILPFNKLGLHEKVAKVLSLKYQKSGLILVTGITGSGKSTTLDSIIDANNRSLEAHIVVIGDPIEYVHQPNKCIVKHREVGQDVHSFKEGTIHALRQDPDIIVIGEMRDADTMMTVLEVVDSGHKVFSTLHTSSAVESIDRILGEMPPNEQNRVRTRLADVLTCVISQKLIPSADGKRVMAKEVMLTNTPIKTAIRNNNTGEVYQIIHQSGQHGMNTMEQDLVRLYKQKVVSDFEAHNNANNKKRFEELLENSS